MLSPGSNISERIACIAGNSGKINSHMKPSNKQYRRVESWKLSRKAFSLKQKTAQVNVI